MPVAAAVRPRRSQGERRASSKARLLDATVASLAERGYAGTSLPEVVRRAGLSNGALWRHFRSKADLMAAASLEAERRLVTVELDDPAGDPVDRVVARLLHWTEQPAMLAIVELLLASRGDPELQAALAELDERASAMFVDVVRRLLGPELAAHPHARGNIRALGLTLYGLTLTHHLRPTGAADDVAHDLRRIVHRLFAA
jgi:AcrR family transcriptional regulator